MHIKVNYDYLQVKSYEYRVDGDNYILSFSERQYIKISKKAKIIMDSFNGQRTLKNISEYLQINDLEFSTFDLRKFVDDILIPNFLLLGQKEKKIRKAHFG